MLEPVNKAFVNNKLFRAMVRPLANIWANASGYRRLGLVYDDLIIEESPEAQEALRRLPADVMAARILRMRRAFQCSLMHVELPPNEWTKPEMDKKYFSPVLDQVKAEFKEREMFDSLKLVK
ncbi:Cytochrome b-c1 complex subunit 7 [Smittium mucronatum]|uniref:Cytochrome b-c1 complex subunit 7 n=1 Tax=Smittium mucronatum TaxID=133383 RepID=A0A1R0GUH7_9FUNG|nr:Cytochrome b-c1 complex subunit 7 [Smittium mucronatum]